MKLGEIARRLEGRLDGDETVAVEWIASLTEAGPKDVSFINDSRYTDQVARTHAAAVIVPRDFNGMTNSALLFVDDVDDALEQLLLIFAAPLDKPESGVHAMACVDPTAQIGREAAVGAGSVIGANVVVGAGSVICPGCVIGRNVQIGDNCYLWPNVVINQDCVLGHNVIIYANSTIGTDGFGYRITEGEHRKIPHIGIVVIEDDVEIGANSCVDRAKFGRTVIGRGTKIDNLVQIAHNVRIGQHCIIVAQTGVAGSSELGNYVIVSGQCGISDHAKIGNNVQIGPQSCVYSGREIKPKAKVMGAPYRPFRTYFRELSLIQKLPEMARQIKQLRKLINKNADTKDHS
ncbi:MAG: UDP-3-O-(3-hydroxymyristoyl)glucosamine N-acyltransferase [Sedimentisphaerales bacterium]|nr:UDP-3-O-(3-hydroxymyristoyl)glucosamine N-acyltransferase [Sedimentisphaerales bacterium]